MDAQVHERDVVLGRFRTTDVFEDVEAEGLPQVVVIPVPSERKGHMKDSLFHEYLGALHQVEDGVIALATEDGVHAGQVGREEASETGNVHDLRVHDPVIYVVAVEPRRKFLYHLSCIFLSLYSIGVNNR
ncbi:hypothetical protein [Parabacteroides merdae]|uniref:hypothetical protein n=1 Tax=Parabacteroides merdae TaxID=46503 RepID=UPI001F041FE3